jgi:enoyl-CoA hydratase/carnithine racemase
MISHEQRDDVAILTLAHGKANLLDVEFCRAVAAALDECAVSPARAAVIIAAGTIFSAGVDLRRLVDGGQRYAEEFLPALGHAFDVAFAFPKPIVAAVNGHAIAGGCILANAADRRLMARGTGRIGVPELLVGVPFPTVALEIMRQHVPPPHLSALIFSGETLVADRAVELGVVDAAVEPDHLLDEAVGAAKAMAALPPAAFAITKKQLRAPALARIREGRERFDAAIHEYWAAPGTLDTVRAYVDRTLKK